MEETLQAFLASEAGLALKAALVAAALDFATGVFAAARDGSFAWGALGAVLRKHILGRVGPLAALLAGAYVSGDELLMSFAIGGLTIYAAETIASVKGNVIPPKDDAPGLAPGEAHLGHAVNPVPQD
jgi:hypothetical protein